MDPLTKKQIPRCFCCKRKLKLITSIKNRCTKCLHTFCKNHTGENHDCCVIIAERKIIEPIIAKKIEII